MIRPLRPSLLLLAIALWAAPASDAAPSRAAAKPAADPAAKARAERVAATKKAAAGTNASARGAAGPRQLDDVHIEGEIPVPQVLFITARDQRRFLDFHHRRYLRTSRELGEATPLPARVTETGAASPLVPKENSR